MSLNFVKIIAKAKMKFEDNRIVCLSQTCKDKSCPDYYKSKCIEVETEIQYKKDVNI